MNKVSVGTGSKVKLQFHRPISRLVALAGVQMKTEICYTALGTIGEVRETELATPEGKPDYEFDLHLENGGSIKVRRSNIKYCYQFV